MSRINLGTCDGKNVYIDMDLLIRERMLIQANSGGGKSYTIRRIVEQAFGKIQIIIIDPEGEFATLREKYGFVLAGRGGDTPADVRSAELLAHKLLEINASCVCDIFEMKPYDRHRWVSLFLNAMINAPKNLWHPVLVIVDEAHKFCPEKGSGESEASEAMIALATTGRKRGFCAIFATQRLGKLRKDASAELQNRLVGPTFEDVDRKRAAELLGVLKSDEREFFKQIQLLEPGLFFALGRAISLDRILVKVGPVETTHPEVGKKYATTAPPPPDQVQKLLPQLGDLPKEAESKAKTESELRAELRTAQQTIRTLQNQKPAPQVDAAAIGKATDRAIREATAPLLAKLTHVRRSADNARQLSEKLSAFFAGIASMETEHLLPAAVKVEPARNDAPRLPSAPTPAVQGNGHSLGVRVPVVAGDLTGPEQKILDAIAWFESIGNNEPKQTAVASVAGYTIGGGAWNNPRGSLRTKGLIEYRGESLVMTQDGRAKANTPQSPLTTQEIQERVLGRLATPERKILEQLIAAYPNPVDNDELARASGYEPGGGAFNNPRGRLRSMGLAEYPTKGQVKAADLLFID